MYWDQHALFRMSRRVVHSPQYTHSYCAVPPESSHGSRALGFKCEQNIEPCETEYQESCAVLVRKSYILVLYDSLVLIQQPKSVTLKHKRNDLR